VSRRPINNSRRESAVTGRWRTVAKFCREFAAILGLRGRQSEAAKASDPGRDPPMEESERVGARRGGVRIWTADPPRRAPARAVRARVEGLAHRAGRWRRGDPRAL